MVEAFSVALWEGIPTTGTLYASENHLCYSSPFLKKNKQIIMSFIDIESMQKENYKTEYIRVRTKSNESVNYFFFYLLFIIIFYFLLFIIIILFYISIFIMFTFILFFIFLIILLVINCLIFFVYIFILLFS